MQLTWVHEQIYAGGGDHIPLDWEAFRDQTGISAILHLNPVEPLNFYGLPPRAYLWMNIDQEKEIDQHHRWEAGLFVQSCVSANLRILIHSGRGLHRVRWIYVAYLIISGSTVKGAMSEAEEKPWLSPFLTDLGEWQVFHQWVKSKMMGED